jgi:hypothetical protein
MTFNFPLAITSFALDAARADQGTKVEEVQMFFNKGKKMTRAAKEKEAAETAEKKAEAADRGDNVTKHEAETSEKKAKRAKFTVATVAVMCPKCKEPVPESSGGSLIWDLGLTLDGKAKCPGCGVELAVRVPKWLQTR